MACLKLFPGRVYELPLSESTVAEGSKGSEWVCQVTQHRKAVWPSVGVPTEQSLGQQHCPRMLTSWPSPDLQNQKLPGGRGGSNLF